MALNFAESPLLPAFARLRAGRQRAAQGTGGSPMGYAPQVGKQVGMDRNHYCFPGLALGIDNCLVPFVHVIPSHADAITQAGPGEKAEQDQRLPVVVGGGIRQSEPPRPC